MRKLFVFKTIISIKETFPIKKKKRKLFLKLSLIKKTKKNLSLEKSRYDLCSAPIRCRHYKYQGPYNYKYRSNYRLRSTNQQPKNESYKRISSPLLRPPPILPKTKPKASNLKAYKSFQKKKKWKIHWIIYR